MKTFFVWVIAVVFATQLVAADGVTEQLQRGLFEEEANRDLNAAIKAYESVIKHSDEERKVIATALFRLAECNRKLGKTNEANAQYQRVLRDFSDQEALVALSRSLLPRDIVQPAPVKPVTDPATLELLRQEIALAEKQASFEEKKAAAGKSVLSLVLEAKRNVLRLKRLLPENATPVKQRELLQQQIELVTKTVREWERKIDVGVLAPGDEIPAKRELVGLQRELAMLAEAPASAPPVTTTPETMTQAEAEELARVKALAKNSPDLLNAPYRDGLTPLQYAAQADFISVMEYLLAQGVDVNAARRSAPPIAIAAGLGHLRAVELLLDRGAEVNAANSDGKTALLSACEKGFSSVAELLLKRGADVNRAAKSGETALHFAVRSGQTNIVALLLARKAEVNRLTNPNPGYRTQSDIRASNFDLWHGVTPLHIAARNGFSTVAKLLLDAGASINATNELGTTPLHIAVAEDHTNVVALLLSYKAEADRMDEHGDTPLVEAITCNRPRSAALLLAAGVNVNRRFSRPDGQFYFLLQFAATTPGSMEVLDLILSKRPNLDPTNSSGMTPLQIAVNNGYPEPVKRLLKAGANPNVTYAPTRNETPLFWAITRGDVDQVKVLLEGGANPNVVNSIGDTPLSTALNGLTGRPDMAVNADRIAELLRKHGADEFLHRRGIIYAASRNSRPSVVFSKGTNQANRYTIYELLATIYEDRGPLFPFPDFASMTVRRLEGNVEKTIPMPIRNALDSGSCDANTFLEWGDIVELPVGDHPLNINFTGLSETNRSTLKNCLMRTVRVNVAGASTNLTLIAPLPSAVPAGAPYSPGRRTPFFRLAYVVIRNPVVSQLLRASSDLSQVVVTRVDPQSKETRRMTFDVNAVALPDMSYGKAPPISWMHDLLLRDGDVIEIPEKQISQPSTNEGRPPTPQFTNPVGNGSSRILPANR